MWVARDKNKELWFYKKKPTRYEYSHIWANYSPKHRKKRYGLRIDDRLFPNLTWEDEPIEIELVDKNWNTLKMSARCHNCKKEFDYTEEDITKDVWVKCPDCGEEICILD